MRKLALILALVMTVFLSCDAFLGYPDGELPPDVINDVLRTGDFSYATHLPVLLSIDFSNEASSRSAADSVIVVQLEGSDGENYFTGATTISEPLTGEALLPADLDSATLKIDSSHYESREIEIDDPARLLSVDRDLGIKGKKDPDGVSDQDRDGIPDIYDAFPTDSTLAFSRSIPASGSLTVAFEDNFPVIGDGDFNDFIASYQIVEYAGPDNQLVYLEGSAVAIARGAGFDHQFGIAIRNGRLPVEAEVRSFDSYGNEIVLPLELARPSLEAQTRLVLFDRTADAFDRDGGSGNLHNTEAGGVRSYGHRAEFRLTYDRGAVPTPTEKYNPYNPYLLVRASSNPAIDEDVDIHLVGQRPLTGSQNPPNVDGFRDPETGSPWALLVPGSWLWPLERTTIQEAYSSYEAWTNSRGRTDSDWYLYPNEEFVYSPE